MTIDRNRGRVRMTCKDCIHFKSSNADKWCQDFKDKSKIIELPCKVGDTVYHFCEFFGVLSYFIESVSVTYFDKTENYITFEANAHSKYDDELLDEIDFDIEDIGKTVFLTKEEADKKI